MKTTGLIKNIFLIPLLLLILGLTLVNCGDDSYDEGLNFKLYESTNYQNSDLLFGSSVALSGNWVVLGMHNGSLSGKIMFYKNNGITWESNTNFSGLSAANIDLQVAVAIDGNYAVMGEINTANPILEGYFTLYFNDGGNWVSNNSWQYPGQFGASVAISGENIIVGAPGTNAVYFGTVSEPSLGEPITNTNVGFGYAVDIDGDYAIVGAYADSVFDGNAYIFHHDGNNWTNDAPIELTNFGAEGFGYSVAICGDSAIVGAPGPDKLAYIYHREGAIWNMVTEINGDGNKPDLVSVAISSSYALVGEANTSLPRHQVHIYRKNSSGYWDDLETLDVNYAITPISINVALDNLHMIVGAGEGSGGEIWFYE